LFCIARSIRSFNCGSRNVRHHCHRSGLGPPDDGSLPAGVARKEAGRAASGVKYSGPTAQPASVPANATKHARLRILMHLFQITGDNFRRARRIQFWSCGIRRVGSDFACSSFYALTRNDTTAGNQVSPIVIRAAGSHRGLIAIIPHHSHLDRRQVHQAKTCENTSRIRRLRRRDFVGDDADVHRRRPASIGFPGSAPNGSAMSDPPRSSAATGDSTAASDLGR
jgi:hypothetical protein